MQAVREADRDRYLAALYAPEDRREALFALYAFNAEVAGIRDRIREALPGEIRLQWWRDVIAGRPADGHPAAEALVEAIDRHGLPRAAFENYLEARLFDLYDDPMPTRADLEGYCGETASALIQLASLVLDPATAAAHGEAAGHAGCAQAIAGLLRVLPVHRRRGQCYVPQDILAAAGTTVADFLATTDHEACERVVSAVTALAREHLAAFGQAAALPPLLRPAYLPVALVPDYLGAVAGRGVAGEGTADIPSWKRHWRLFRAATAAARRPAD